MTWKKTFLWLLALPCAAALILVASTTSGQSTSQTSPSTGMMSTPMGGGMMTTPMGGMTMSPAPGMSTTPWHGGAMATTPGTMTREQMMAQMEESNRRLDELVSSMNSATGSAKVDAIAAVVNELVAQHRQMHEHMRSQMHEHMMGGRPGMKGGKRMMGMPGTTSTTPGTSGTPKARRRTPGAGTTSGSTSPAASPTPLR
jgi:hypothetical protein